MKLRDNFPKTTQEARVFDMEFKYGIGVFKNFKNNDKIEKTVNDVNEFLVKNGYDKVPLVKFLLDENSYISEDEVVSLGLHEYQEALVLFIENEENNSNQYTNLNNHTINLLKEFFQLLKDNVKKKSLPKLLKTLSDIGNLPNKPKQNIFISFDYNNKTFYVSISDYKIELSCYFEDSYNDTEGNRSDRETIKQYSFLYEIEGYTDIIGGFDMFRILLLDALENTSDKPIYLSEEE